MSKRLDTGTWLREEMYEHTRLLTQLRERLSDALEQSARPADDVPMTWQQAKPLPEKHWIASYREYRGGLEMHMAEERERARMLIMANKRGQELLTDEQYEREMKEIAAEAIRELDVDALRAELQRRDELS